MFLMPDCLHPYRVKTPRPEPPWAVLTDEVLLQSEAPVPVVSLTVSVILKVKKDRMEG